MFDVMVTFMTQFIQILPGIICIILVLNLCAFLLWGGR